MKTKILIMLGVLGLVLAQFCYAQCSSCYHSETYVASSCRTCGSSNYSCESVRGCNCTDPTCYRSDSCLDRRSCCAAFGNVGRY